jgi:hypothetical protein
MMTLATLLLALAPQLPDTMAVDLGTRVRIVTRAIPRQPLVGVMRANDSGRVMVVVSDRLSAVSIPWKDVTDLSWSKGRAQGRGMVVGAVLGLVGGAVAYSIAAKPGPGDDPFGLDRFAAGVLGFGAAPAVGALVGSLIVPERWEHVAPPRTWEPPATAKTVSLHFAPTERIRVSARSQQLIGRPESNTLDTLTLVTSAGAIPLPWSGVTRVEVHGARIRWVGALLGTGAGLLLAVIGLSDSPTTGSTEGAYILSGIAGAGLGAVILAPRRWKSLPLPSR